jgi:hypothetical protein
MHAERERQRHTKYDICKERDRHREMYKDKVRLKAEQRACRERDRDRQRMIYAKRER